MTKVWQKGIWKVHLEKWKPVNDAPCPPESEREPQALESQPET